MSRSFFHPTSICNECVLKDSNQCNYVICPNEECDELICIVTWEFDPEYGWSCPLCDQPLTEEEIKFVKEVLGEKGEPNKEIKKVEF